jgi:hypothetical protein
MDEDGDAGTNCSLHDRLARAQNYNQSDTMTRHHKLLFAALFSFNGWAQNPPPPAIDWAAIAAAEAKANRQVEADAKAEEEKRNHPPPINRGALAFERRQQVARVKEAEAVLFRKTYTERITGFCQGRG